MFQIADMLNRTHFEAPPGLALVISWCARALSLLKLNAVMMKYDQRWRSVRSDGEVCAVLQVKWRRYSQNTEHVIVLYIDGDDCVSVYAGCCDEPVGEWRTHCRARGGCTAQHLVAVLNNTWWPHCKTRGGRTTQHVVDALHNMWWPHCRARGGHTCPSAQSAQVLVNT